MIPIDKAPPYLLEQVLQQMERDRPEVLAFCIRRGAHLQEVWITSERAPEIPYEAMYIFDDGRGGYTIDGIENELREKQKRKSR